MKVLVLTISAGDGHNKTARAIGEYLKDSGVEIEIIDTYKYFNTALSKLVEKGYLLSTKFTPGIYGSIYAQEEKRQHKEKMNVVDMAGRIIARQFFKFIEQKKPDAIVTTHIFAANLVSRFKRKRNYEGPTFGVITDFTVHPFWETVNLDYYVTPTALLNNQMVKKGISEEKILPFGIPIEKKFAETIEKSEARKLLGVEDKPTVFVMTGSMGYGDVIRYICELDNVDADFQIITVCGKNKNLKEEIDLLETKKKIYNYGFVNNVDVIMSAADILVSKPGGLTVSEALAKELPMILIDPIPGQEDRNFEFLVNNGLAVGTSKTFSVEEALYQLVNSETRIRNMRLMAQEVGNRNSSKELSDFIIDLIKE